MPSVKVVLGVGLVLLALGVGLVVLGAPVVVIGDNSVASDEAIAFSPGNTTGCQDVGTVPRGTSGIRVSLLVNIGPRVRVRVLQGSQLITQGEQRAGWGVQNTVTVPVRAISRTLHNAVVCLSLGPAAEILQLHGTRISSTGSPNRGINGIAPRLEYLRTGTRSWASMALSIARRMGMGHAFAGTWVVLFLLALLIAIGVFAGRLALDELR